MVVAVEAAAGTEGLAEGLAEVRGTRAILSGRSTAAAAIDVAAAAVHTVDPGAADPEAAAQGAAGRGVTSRGRRLPFKPSPVFMEMI